MRPSYGAAIWLALANGAQAFMGSSLIPNVASSRNTRERGAERTVVPCCKRGLALSMTQPGESTSRRQFAERVLGGGAVGMAVAMSPALSKPALAATETLENLEADLMICKEVFKPTLQYLKAEQFDAARTNTNYITRFFNLKKKIDKFIVLASDVVDDADEMERAFDMAQEVEALFTNFDASVYTIIFIPADADGVLPPGAEKYLKQAYGFYDDINKVLDFYIGLVPPETKKAAEKMLPDKRAPLPKFLFKEQNALMREKVAIS
eukprot:jgi/Undpi1/2231/HiC_scaffold_12.g05617.m1